MRPTNEEVNEWLNATLRHSYHVEYYLNELNIGNREPERPHDLVGPGNKLEWEVIRGMALTYREPKVNFKEHILPSIMAHREQHHHKMWNEPSKEDETRPNPEATIQAMLLGADDTVCSMLESRAYGGGKDEGEQFGREHSWAEVESDGFCNFSPHKRPWIAIVVPYMKRLERPKLEALPSAKEFSEMSIGAANKLFTRHMQYYDMPRRFQESIRYAISRLESLGYTVH